jgi:hypothetical protein
LYNSLLLEEAGSNVILITGELELKNPKTRMNMIGKRKLKITAEGLLNIEVRLALEMASMAFH